MQKTNNKKPEKIQIRNSIILFESSNNGNYKYPNFNSQVLNILFAQILILAYKNSNVDSTLNVKLKFT